MNLNAPVKPVHIIVAVGLAIVCLAVYTAVIYKDIKAEVDASVRALREQALMSSAQAPAEPSLKIPFQVASYVEDLEHPWGIAFLPDGDVLVTERPGRLRIIRSGVLDSEPVKGLPPIISVGQGGLLDVALHPDFTENRWVYLTLVAGTREAMGTELYRGRLNADKTVLEDVQQLFVMTPKSDGTPHFGSRIVFDGKGHVLISLGDRGVMEQAQNLNAHNGKIIRLHDDGRIPQDNPFVGRSDALPEIYSLGHRNSQGLVLSPLTGELWETEHGPRGGDELNIIQPGKNYGWPLVTYGIDYDGSEISPKTEAPGLEKPVVQWTPSIAPSGMIFYTGDAFPEWKGSLFVGSLAYRHLQRLIFDGSGRIFANEQILNDLNERIRDVEQGPDGFIYVLTDDPNGRILVVKPGE